MVVASLITIPIAVYFSAEVSSGIFKILLGTVLIILSIYFLFFNKNVKIKPNFKNGVISGGLGGILGGLFSTGGPPAVLYLSNATKNNITYFATIQFYFFFTNWYATIMRVANGIVNTQIIIYAIIGIIGCMTGDFIGKTVINKLNPEKLKYIIYIGMIISGIIMFF
jgi:uncharacterized membrane protein YfcA